MTSIPGITEVIQLYASTVFQAEFDSPSSPRQRTLQGSIRCVASVLYSYGFGVLFVPPGWASDEIGRLSSTSPLHCTADHSRPERQQPPGYIEK
jgi:hypothetical protein